MVRRLRAQIDWVKLSRIGTIEKTMMEIMTLKIVLTGGRVMAEAGGILHVP